MRPPLFIGHRVGVSNAGCIGDPQHAVKFQARLQVGRGTIARDEWEEGRSTRVKVSAND